MCCKQEENKKKTSQMLTCLIVSQKPSSVNTQSNSDCALNVLLLFVVVKSEDLAGVKRTQVTFADPLPAGYFCCS